MIAVSLILPLAGAADARKKQTAQGPQSTLAVNAYHTVS